MSISGSLDLRLRPLKLAFAVDINNVQQMKEAIRINTYLWGGMYNPIIPVHKRIPSNWGYLAKRSPESFTRGYFEAYDPDFIVKMGKSLPVYLENTGVKLLDSTEFTNLTTAENLPKASYGIGIERLLNDLYEQEFKYQRRNPIRFVIPRPPQKHNLFFASLYGEYDPAVRNAIMHHFKGLLDIEELDFQADKIQELFGENVLFPRRMTIRGLENTERSVLRRDSYLLVMDAKKPHDILDYWNLRALGREVFPLPIQFIGDDAWLEAAKKFLHNRRRIGEAPSNIFRGVSVVKSAGIAIADMRRFTALLPTNFTDKVSEETGRKYPIQVVFPRIWNEWARSHDGVVCDDFYLSEENISVGNPVEDRIVVKPLMATFANSYSFTGNPMYANEIDLQWSGSSKMLAECFPRETDSHLLNAIGYGGLNFGDWRIGRNGVVSYIKGPQSKFWEMPLSEKVFFAWLKDQGWEATLSTSGVLAKEIFKRLDGNVNAFKYDGFIELLEHVNGGKSFRKADNSVTDMILADRNMVVPEIRNRLSQIFRNPEMYEFLAKKGVFQLGIRSKCPVCGRHSWFPLREISDEFHCPKCLNPFSAITNIENGEWSVKTGGPFSIGNYGEGAYCVLLAYKFLKDFGRLLSLSTTAVFSFNAKSSTGTLMEADLGCFWRERFFDDSMDGLLFSECKSFGEFKATDFKKMELLGKNFPGAILMFCTLRDHLSKREIAALRRIAKTGRRYWKDDRSVNPVLILTKTELRSLVGVPMCWDSETISKFKNNLGLLHLCDATQQIYLGLPPVEEYWQAGFEKKQQRRNNIH
jgi:hypothetical protein